MHTSTQKLFVPYRSNFQWKEKKRWNEFWIGSHSITLEKPSILSLRMLTFSECFRCIEDWREQSFYHHSLRVTNQSCVLPKIALEKIDRCAFFWENFNQNGEKYMTLNEKTVIESSNADVQNKGMLNLSSNKHKQKSLNIFEKTHFQ